jgi:hypothetical protein
MKILFKYTTRSRPELFKRGMDSIIDNCVSENYQILVSVDENDTTMFGMEEQYKNNSKVVFCKGVNNNKIFAINRDMNVITDWDILVNMSDDMVFTQRGFDAHIRGEFDNLDQCLHFPDGNRNDLMTMSIFGRNYYERFGYIYHPDYISLYCDNEAMEVAKILGCYKYVNKEIFHHLHPAYGKAKLDTQYTHTESFSNADLTTYLKRRNANFGL